MGVHGWDLGELVYSIVAILFWSGGILAVPALYIWLRIWEAREAPVLRYDDPNPPCPPYGDAASGH